METEKVVLRFLLVKSTEERMENFEIMRTFVIMKSIYGLIGETYLIIDTN